MAVGDKQKLITNNVSTVLGELAQTDKKFDWFVNKHLKEHFGRHFPAIDKIFKALNGDINANQSKRTTSLDCDAYFGGKYNLIFEFDEYQHFSSARLKTFDYYPSDLKTNYSIIDWKNLCIQNKNRADNYRHSKVTTDFNFNGGRTAQRAYLDCFRDFLPEINGLNPTLRITDFEVADIYSPDTISLKKVEKLIKQRLR